MTWNADRLADASIYRQRSRKKLLWVPVNASGMGNMLQNELAVRRAIYLLLLATAPGFLFMIQAVQFSPPASIFGSLASAIQALFFGDEVGSPVATGVIALHFILLAGFYWLVAFGLGKLVLFFQQPSTAGIVLFVIVLGILGVSQLPLYGSGGHGSSQLGSLQSLFVEPNALSRRSLPLYLGSLAFFLLFAAALTARQHRHPK